VVADRAVEAVPADPRDLERAERRVVGLHLDDRPADPEWQAPPIRLGRRLHLEQAAHADGLEARRLAPQGPFRHPGFAGARRRRLPEEHDRAQLFVGRLLGRPHQEAELLPVVGRPRTPPSASRHDPSSGKRHPTPRMLGAGLVRI
jgi:hypothetical protein